MSQRRDLFLQEMGLGPRWVLRAGVPDAGGVAAPDQPAPAPAPAARAAGWLFIAPDEHTDGPGARLLANILAALGVRLDQGAALLAPADAGPAALTARAPAVVVVFGAAAAAQLAPGVQRGDLQRVHGMPLLVTHAIADLLANPALKAQAWADLCLAMDAHVAPT